MIIVITAREHNKRTGAMEQIASHGINTDNDKIVVLPQEPVASIARFDDAIGEWVLP